MKLAKTWQNVRSWIIKNYQETNEAEATNLIWVKRTIKPNETIDWSFVDTVDYNIDSIPRKRELIAEFKVKTREVMKKCPSLLN